MARLVLHCATASAHIALETLGIQLPNPPKFSFGRLIGESAVRMPVEVSANMSKGTG